jgi:hypothetical protein
MSTNTDPTNPTPSPTAAAERLELLISRLAGGDASPGDWEAFAALARGDPSAWRTLAQAQRDHQALSLAVGVALHAADHVELPVRSAAASWEEAGRRPGPNFRRVVAIGGWTVAAAMALAWLGPVGRFNLPGPTNTGGLTIPAGYVKVQSPEDALQAYVDVGQKQNRVLGELGEPVMVKRRATEDGRIEVVYIRQFVERAELDKLVRFGQDEAGRLHPVPVSVPRLPAHAD